MRGPWDRFGSIFDGPKGTVWYRMPWGRDREAPEHPSVPRTPLLQDKLTTELPGRD